MKILITGAAGQLGSELMRQLTLGRCSLGKLPNCYHHAALLPMGREQLDVTDFNAVMKLFERECPELVLHCAAISNVDICEADPKKAEKVNTQAAGFVARACKKTGAKLIYLSSDYVFSGEKKMPCEENELCGPINVYGQSKLQGEALISKICSRYFIIRTAWLYSTGQRNFVQAIRKQLVQSEKVYVVNDQAGSPTNVEDLAYQILNLAATEYYGLYHCTNIGMCTRYALAKRIAAFEEKQDRIIPCATGDYPALARRPKCSALSSEKISRITGIRMRTWEEALDSYMSKELYQKRKRVLVTGASGYIGSHVVQALLALGHQVVAVDRIASKIDPRAEVLLGDIFGNQRDFYIEAGCPDVLVHLAWLDGFIHDSHRHMEQLSNHFGFLDRMMSAGISQVAVMGTMHEVGYWEGRVDERTPCDPQSMYGIAKYALRQSLLALQKEYPDTVIQWLRAYYIMGEDSKNHSIFTKILQAEIEGKTTFPLNSGKNLYDFIDVRDLAMQIAASATQDRIRGIIECCSGMPKSLKDAVEAFIEAHRLSIRLEYGAFPDRPYDSPGIWGDASKIEEIMGALENT